MLHRLITLLCLPAFVLSLAVATGCSEDAGDEMEDAAEEVQDTAEDAADEAGDAMENAADEAEEATDSY